MTNLRVPPLWRRLFIGTGLICGLSAGAVIILGFVATWTPDSASRCFRTFGVSQFPKWIGCALATHDALGGSLILAVAAIFAAWLAYVGVQDQIGMARANEQEAARLKREQKVIEALNNLQLIRLAYAFVRGIADTFPDPKNTRTLPAGTFSDRLLTLRRSGGLQMSSNAARAPDGNGESITTVMGRLKTQADNIYEEIQGVAAEIAQSIKQQHDPTVIAQVEALHHLAGMLSQRVGAYELRVEQASKDSA